MDNRDPYELFTMQETADRLRINRSYLSKLTQEGLIYHVRIGKRVVYPRAAIEAFIRGERVEGNGSWPPTPPIPGVDGDTDGT